MNNLSAFKFRSGNQDRVTDNRPQFYLRLDDHQRANSPRQRRLAAQRKHLIATHHAIISEVLGFVCLALLVILFFFI